MGNAVGNLQEYWDEIYSNPRMLGGFIWEWVDQGLHKTAPDGTVFTALGRWDRICLTCSTLPWMTALWMFNACRLLNREIATTNRSRIAKVRSLWSFLRLFSDIINASKAIAVLTLSAAKNNRMAAKADEMLKGERPQPVDPMLRDPTAVQAMGASSIEDYVCLDVIEPAKGDIIRQTAGQTVLVYQVLAPGSAPVAELEADGQWWRIHTKRIGIEPA
jgi:hypothetical protein